MFPSGASMTGFSAQQWAAFAAMTGQPAVGNAHSFQLGSLDSNGVVLGAVGPGYLRLAPDSGQQSVMSGSSLHSAQNPYGSHPTLGYAMQPSVDTPVAGRQLPSTGLPQYLQHYSTNVPVSQALSFQHGSMSYGQSYPYIQPLVPTLCNGGLSQIQPCQTIPQQHTPLVSGFESSLRVFDSLKHFGAIPQEQNRRAKSMIPSKTNLYISGLNESDNDETVRSLVGNLVKPKSCKAMMNNGVCKGYGFIDCATEEDAEKAKSYIMANANAGGRKLLVKFAHENEKDVLNVYVRHLPADFTKDKLESLFRKYGEITSVKLLENEDRLTGIGFVRYARAEQAERAIEQMNSEQLYLGGNTAPVTCKLADKPNARRRIVNSAHATSTLLSLPLTNSVNRHSASIGSSNSSHRGPSSFSHSQSSGFNQAAPFTTQMITPLNQPQVILHSLPATAASPQSRGVLSPGVLTNGNPSSLLPLSFPPVPSCPTASNRANPLIGPPPQTSNLQSNQNTTNLTGANFLVTHVDNNASKSPTVSSVASRFGNAANLPSETISTDNGASSSPQAVSSVGTPTLNPQLLLFPHASSPAAVQSSVSSVFPYFPCGSLTQPPQTPQVPSHTQPTVGHLTSANAASMLNFDSAVHLASAELRAMSLEPNQPVEAHSGYCSSLSLANISQNAPNTTVVRPDCSASDMPLTDKNTVLPSVVSLDRDRQSSSPGDSHFPSESSQSVGQSHPPVDIPRNSLEADSGNQHVPSAEQNGLETPHDQDEYNGHQGVPDDDGRSEDTARPLR